MNSLICLRLRLPPALLSLSLIELKSFCGRKKMVNGLINENPIVYEIKHRRDVQHHIRDIKDPEHPYSLEQLKVLTEDSVEVDDSKSHVRVTFTPTVEHCSMATIIGLCVRVKLMRSLPRRYKIDIRVAPGTHATEAAVNKQLNDKERVAAALENPNLVEMVDECLSSSFE
ncbi:MIP18 family protein [Raphanus sativus]|nr:MIP18 family protein [Raphanus sativus]